MGDDKATIELHGPAGFWGKLSGLTGEHILHAVIIVQLVALLFMVQASDNDRDKRYVGLQGQVHELLKQGRQTQENQTVIIRALANTNDEQRSITYVLTLSESERKALKLVMPDALRARTNNR